MKKKRSTGKKTEEMDSLNTFRASSQMVRSSIRCVGEAERSEKTPLILVENLYVRCSPSRTQPERQRGGRTSNQATTCERGRQVANRDSLRFIESSLYVVTKSMSEKGTKAWLAEHATTFKQIKHLPSEKRNDLDWKSRRRRRPGTKAQSCSKG